jgi:hypothetical protein
MIGILSKVLLVILWVATFVVAVVWIFVKEPPFNPEPLTIILGLLATAVTALLSEYSSLLKKESFTPAYALAYGYINNFLEPAVTSLAKQHQAQPIFYIFIPEKLSELEPRSIERIIAAIRQKNFKDQILTLDFAEGRARDIISLRGLNNKEVYFDFPNTLLTLKSFIDFKVSHDKRRIDSNERDELGNTYIQKFKEAVQQLSAEKGLAQHIRFVDRNLEIEN